MRLEVFPHDPEVSGSICVSKRAIFKGGCFFPSDRLRCANNSIRKCSKVFKAVTIYSKRLHAFTPCPSQSVRRAYDAHAHLPPPPTYLLQRFSFPPRGGDNPSRRGRFKMLARVGASRATEATSRKHSFLLQASPRACSSSRRP